jgi:hypothetical protein
MGIFLYDQYYKPVLIFPSWECNLVEQVIKKAQRPRLSRLADLAGCLPPTIVLGFKAVDNTNEDTEPKAKSASAPCWAPLGMVGRHR